MNVLLNLLFFLLTFSCHHNPQIYCQDFLWDENSYDMLLIKDGFMVADNNEFQYDNELVQEC